MRGLLPSLPIQRKIWYPESYEKREHQSRRVYCSLHRLCRLQYT